MSLLDEVRGRLVTGERVTQSHDGFNPNHQCHVASYRAAAERLPPGRVLDLGAGVGHSFAELAPRETVGLDVDAEALGGEERETVVADMRALPFPAASFASALGVHSIEHIPDPERALAEIARVLEDDGTCMLVTPNRLTSPGRTRSSILLKQDQSARLDRILGLDPLRLRRLVPRRGKQLVYDVMHTRGRKRTDPRATAITAGDFSVGTTGVEAALGVIAIATEPRRAS